MANRRGTSSHLYWYAHKTVTGTGGVAGAGAFSGTGTRKVLGTGGYAGAGAYSGTGTRKVLGTGGVAGSGAFSGTGTVTRSGTGGIAGTGAWSGTGTVTTVVAATTTPGGRNIRAESEEAFQRLLADEDEEILLLV